MKKRMLFPIALVSALVISGCVKENFNEASAVEAGTVEFTAGISTKTVLQGDGKVLWTDGDKINVNGYESAALELESPSETATFRFTDAVIEGTYKAVFPSSIYKDENTVTLPAYQTYKAGTFAEAASPMAAKSETKDLVFHHLCAVIKLNVTLPAESEHSEIAYVDFYGKNDEQVSGDFTVDYGKASLAGASEAEADKKIRYKVDEAFEDGKFEMYIVVPAGDYSNGYAVKVLDSRGHYMEVEKKSAATLVAGNLYDMPSFEFVPDKTEFGVEIASAEDLITFAQAYNDGEYADEDLLIATLTSDIIFDKTTSAEFAATGGIGVKGVADKADNYFNGIFNGQNKVIKGYTANIPLFTATNAGTVIKDFTIDESSSFTFDATKLDYMSAVVGYHRGTIENVTVASDITIADAELTSGKALGSICGRIVIGNVTNCTYTGNISVPAGFSASGAIVHVGGIAGMISNADGEISKTYFKGTLDFAGHVQSTDKGNPYLRLGGIVGSNTGTVSDCEVTKDKTFNAVNSEFVTSVSTSYSIPATIANRTTKSYFTAEGGVVGMNEGTVLNCTNNADFVNFILTTGTDGGASDANSRYIYCGGIAGYNKKEVSGCTNNGGITNRSTPRILKLGGIVGYNDGVVRGCENSSEGAIAVATSGVAKPWSARLPYVGGIIGQNNSSDVSDVQNHAALAISRIEDTDGSDVRFGGIIGHSTAAIDGLESKNISNSGDLTVTNGISNVTKNGYFEGGIVGYAEASVANVVNTGAVTHKNTTGLQKLYLSGVVGYLSSADNVNISNCRNEGEVYFNAATASKEGSIEYTNNFIGGILAYSTSNVAVSSCENTGYVHGGNDSKVNGKTLYAGGIVGYLKGQSSISSCYNNGDVYNGHSNNNDDKDASVFGGGIVGFVEGEAGNVISVNDCHVKNDNNFNQLRGYLGGIAGYAEYAHLSNCSNNRNFVCKSRSTGGIAGWLVNATISKCNWTGTILASSNLDTVGGGGIVAKLGEGGVIDGCSCYLREIYDRDSKTPENCKCGIIAGQSVSGSIIRNCHYVSGLDVDICSDTNFTGENNSADLL